MILINFTKDGFSAIWIACQRGHLQVVKYLKDRGARLDYICKVGIIDRLVNQFYGPYPFRVEQQQYGKLFCIIKWKLCNI